MGAMEGKGRCLFPSVILILALTVLSRAEIPGRNILIFGGNGFMGGSLVEKLLEAGDSVTMVNRGNWYWDSFTRIRPHTRHVKCDRKIALDKCDDWQKVIEDGLKFDSVFDFSAYGGAEVSNATKTLQDHKMLDGLYVLISTDSIYDVCTKTHAGPSKETDAVRPKSDKDREELNKHHSYGHNKMEAEEELMKQRLEGGYSFVILRLPDVVGPRDTTYRWWVYQLWLKMAPSIPEKPVTIPHFLANYPMSLVYVEDVTRILMDLLIFGPQIKDQAINLAYSDVFTLEQILRDIQTELGEQTEFKITDENETNIMYLYPTVRKGPIDVTKAESLINWKPTPWQDVLKDTVGFYEKAMTDETFHTQRDEIIQIIMNQLYGDRKSDFFKHIEDMYKIELHHFTHHRDEL